MNAGDQNSFVADGRERLREGYRAQVTEQVRLKYQAQLAAAAAAERFLVEKRIRAEIEAELDRLAPPGASY